jgi:hypothetical protein
MKGKQKKEEDKICNVWISYMDRYIYIWFGSNTTT